MKAYAKTLLTVLINNLSFKDAGIRQEIIKSIDKFGLAMVFFFLIEI